MPAAGVKAEEEQEEEGATVAEGSAVKAEEEALERGPGDEAAPATELLEFAVRVDRSSGEALGIDIESGRESAGWDGRTLLVKQVHEAGLFGAWAAANPAAAVLPGDRIVEANGRRGDAAALIEECRGRRPLELRVARELPLPHCAPAGPGAGAQPKLRRIPDGTLAAIREELAAAGSAAAAVAVVRKQLGRNWDFQWGAEALTCILRRSTALTRKGWSEDPAVVHLASRLRAESAGNWAPSSAETVLLALDALRRMAMQEPEAQRPALEAVRAGLAAGGLQLSASGLARLLWLAAPLQLEGLEPARLEARRRFLELTGRDVAALAAALRRSAVRTLLRGPREPRTGAALGGSLKLAPEAVLSFDLLPRCEAKEWACVLRLAAVDERGAERPGEGGSLPELYFAPGTTRLLLALGAPEAAELQLGRCAVEGLPVGQMSRVTLRLLGKTCAVLVNGKEVLTSPWRGGVGSPAGETVRVWGGSRQHTPASALIGNLTYRPLQHCPGRDAELLERLLRRLRTEGLLEDLSAAELSELADCLAELGAPLDRAAFRALGQEVLQRRPEFTPEELWRVRVSFALCGMSLNKVWTEVGAKTKHAGGRLVTRQAFATQAGHEKRRKTDNEVERASPPRQFADLVRSSY